MSRIERRVRVFRNGANRALRIPRDMDFEGDEAILRKEGDILVVTPVRKGRLLELIESWEPIDDAFPEIDDDLGPLDDIRL